jgi:hypothetical protein
MTNDDGLQGMTYPPIVAGDMKTSLGIAEIATALCKAQASMGGAHKDSANPFFKSRYADLASVMRAIREPFASNGLSFIQCPIVNDDGVGVTTRILHSSGEWIEGTLVLPVAKRDAQAFGSALSYAKRYSIQAMAGVPSTDDDAELALGRASAPPVKLVGSEAAAELKTALEATGSDVAKFCTAFAISDVDSLPMAQFASAMSMLNKKREAAKCL